MKKPDWDRIQEIFCEALQQPPSKRNAFVEEACAGNSFHLREVNSLLGANNSPGGILESPVFSVGHELDDPLGTIAGRYLIERRLGHGGMGEVYLALDLNVNRRVVVLKVLSVSLRDDLYARQKFQQEAEALSRVRHDGVVDVLDIGNLADGRPFFVMPYIEGETLRSQIRTHGMNLRRVASILKQIGAALEHVHDRNIYHRDLKPENIMLKPNSDSVVLIDFGIARVNNSNIAPPTANGVSPGTLPYMSPEQLRGDEITAASDIYSMGVVAYEMVTGRRPFNPESMAQLLELQRRCVRAEPVDLRPGIPRKAQEIILRSLSFEARDRYQNAKNFGDELADALLTREATVVGGGRRSLSLKKRTAAIISAIIIISLVYFGLYIGIPNGPPTPPQQSKGFNYWLMVQQMRDGKEYKTPYKSNGDDIFDAGDKFQLNVSSLNETGYVYIFSESSPVTNSVSVRLIYPKKTINNGSATLGPNQTLFTEWFTFRGPSGAENFWIVWSVSPVSELESAKNQAFIHAEAGLTGENLVALKEFLTTTRDRIKVRDASYKADQECKVRSKNDLVLTLAQFKHR